MHNFCTWRRVHHQEWKNHGTPALHSLNIMEKDNEDNDKWRMLFLCLVFFSVSPSASPQCTFMIYDYTSLKTAKNIITVVEAVEEKTNAKQLQQNQWNLECEFSNHQKTLNNAQSVQKLSNMSQLKKSTEFCWVFFYVKKMRLF